MPPGKGRVYLPGNPEMADSAQVALLQELVVNAVPLFSFISSTGINHFLPFSFQQNGLQNNPFHFSGFQDAFDIEARASAWRPREPCEQRCCGLLGFGSRQTQMPGCIFNWVWEERQLRAQSHEKQSTTQNQPTQPPKQGSFKPKLQACFWIFKGEHFFLSKKKIFPLKSDINALEIKCTFFSFHEAF